ncbi:MULTISPECIES: DUF1648 domain-containing protein [Streptomyces]|uniref:DUF1648 domain-containing protein n=1 Tax=Streptomyces TaxID=1883 RepID=UPI00167B40B0|nr:MULTISPECIES: DUF1648 domain-containing protein [Streptomyces]MBD3574955.1 DUF1648 domain-containing protein [Streptomyces sp. KD18]GGT24363.1 hypothetical protein GCM10010286_57360 [Streptomyces toxytricini]
MTDGKKRNGARWAAATWAAGVSAFLAALPFAASGRLPDRLATHWSGGTPDGSMPLWAAALAPALVWAVLALSLAFAGRRNGPGPAGAWVGVSLLSGGVGLAGAQAVLVRANLDRADWHDAGPVGAGVALTAAAAAAAGLLGLLAARRAAPAVPVRPAAAGTMDIPPGERRVWLSRTSNPWLHLTAALTGLVAAAAAAAAAGGLIGLQWPLIAPFAVASLLSLGCASVQARVTDAGLEVSFGPLGWPVRRWAAHDIVSARAETRTPAQVGGWGYRLGGQGTTVMLRSGECLVVRPRKGPEFAVSVDDAERGAALLNALGSRPQSAA